MVFMNIWIPIFLCFITILCIELDGSKIRSCGPSWSPSWRPPPISITIGWAWETNIVEYDLDKLLKNPSTSHWAWALGPYPLEFEPKGQCALLKIFGHSFIAGALIPWVLEFLVKENKTDTHSIEATYGELIRVNTAWTSLDFHQHDYPKTTWTHICVLQFLPKWVDLFFGVGVDGSIFLDFEFHFISIYFPFF